MPDVRAPWGHDVERTRCLELRPFPAVSTDVEEGADGVDMDVADDDGQPLQFYVGHSKTTLRTRGRRWAISRINEPGMGAASAHVHVDERTGMLMSNTKSTAPSIKMAATAFSEVAGDHTGRPLANMTP